jgi:tetratricopeptide (TPR) repeat protein
MLKNEAKMNKSSWLKKTLILVSSYSTLSLAAGGDPDPAPAAPQPKTSGESPSSPSSPQKELDLIQALLDSGDFNQAHGKLDKALKGLGSESNQIKARFHNLMGFALRQKQQWKEAVKSYDEALKLDPNLNLAKEYLAVAYLHLKDIKKAKALHQELLKLDPKLAKMIEVEAEKLKVKL